MKLKKISIEKLGLIFLCCLILLFSFCSETKQTGSLPRAKTPETENVSSAGLIKYLDALKESGMEFHSIMIVRHGKVVSEGWWKPAKADSLHVMHSVSKSFTSSAIGFAVTENLLAVKDKVISFFQDELPDSISPYLEELTVKDLLTMSVGHENELPIRNVPADTTWVKAFLCWPITHPPGTFYMYNTPATYMLSAIVQKVTGQKLLDYLTPRLFQPLSIEGALWEESPQGINMGGFGLYIKTEDMAKFGQLYLQKGRWNGIQVLPESWIDEATSLQINQGPAWAKGISKEESDWNNGYGYQFWRSRHNSYRADGAYGQYIIIIPEKDAVIINTANVNDMQKELNLIWDFVLPALSDDKLPVDIESAKELKKRLSDL